MHSNPHLGITRLWVNEKTSNLDVSIPIKLIAVLGDVSVDSFSGRLRRMDAGDEPTGRAQRRIHGVP